MVRQLCMLTQSDSEPTQFPVLDTRLVRNLIHMHALTRIRVRDDIRNAAQIGRAHV